jgi:hypothetical protein
MATMFDLSLFQSFSNLFAFLFVFVLVFGVLELRNFLKNSGLHALIALFISTLVATSSNVMPMIAWMTPWFVMLIVFFVFLILMLRFIGLEETQIVSGLGGKTGLTVSMLIIVSIIFIAALGHIYGQQTLELTTGPQNVTGATGAPGTVGESFRENVAAVFFHPKILGLLLVLLIGAFTVRLLANPT